MADEAKQGNEGRGIMARVPDHVVAGIEEAAATVGMKAAQLREVVRARAEAAVAAEFSGDTALSAAVRHVEEREAARQEALAARLAEAREKLGVTQ